MSATYSINNEPTNLNLIADRGEFNVSLLPSADVQADAALTREWKSLLKRFDSPNLLFASPTWFEHVLGNADKAEWLLAVVRDHLGGLVGACPVRIGPYRLTYDVSNRVLLKSTLTTACVFGCEFMLPSLPGLLELFFRSVLESHGQCDGIYLPTVPTHSAVFKFLNEDAMSSRYYVPYLPYGVRPWHCLELTGDFESFLAARGSKTRSTLRRKVRRLRDHMNGAFEFLRVTEECQIDAFLEPAARVSEKTWQHDVLGIRFENTPSYAAMLKDLARRRLLRAYLLRSAGQPCAFLIGFDYCGVFQYEETGFDPSFADLSAGTVLLYLVIEDLFKHNPPRLVNFGIGDAVHKRRFANREYADAGVLLLRRTVRNRIRRGGHRLFQSALNLAKRVLRRSVTK